MLDIDYTKIIKREDLEKMDKDKYAEAKNGAKEYVAISCKHYGTRFLGKSDRDNEANSVMSKDKFRSRFKNCDDLQKSVIAANALICDTECFVETLAKYASYKCLDKMVKWIPVLQKLQQTTCKDKLDITVIDEKTERIDNNWEILCRRLNNDGYPFSSKELIINRIVEVVTFEKELYMSYENKKSEKQETDKVKKIARK